MGLREEGKDMGSLTGLRFAMVKVVRSGLCSAYLMYKYAVGDHNEHSLLIH